jgi:predicted RNase H-like HicB family nuclease
LSGDELNIKTGLAFHRGLQKVWQANVGAADSREMKTIHAVFQNDGVWFIARCLDLPVTTQGKTLAAAKKNLQEAVELYFETWVTRRNFWLPKKFT